MLKIVAVTLCARAPGARAFILGDVKTLQVAGSKLAVGNDFIKALFLTSCLEQATHHQSSQPARRR